MITTYFNSLLQTHTTVGCDSHIEMVENLFVLFQKTNYEETNNLFEILYN